MKTLGTAEAPAPAGCFRPKPCFRAPFATCLEHAHYLPYQVDPESVSFSIRLLDRGP